MARPSRIERKTQLSVTLGIITVVALAIAVRAFQHQADSGGVVLVAVATIAIAWLMAFAVPVRCKVITGRRRPCPNWSYGFLFGCRNIAGHKWGKFYWRLGVRDEVTEVGRPKVERSSSVRYASGPAPPIVVKVEGNGMDKCDFWFGLVSTVAAVASVGLTLVQLHVL